MILVIKFDDLAGTNNETSIIKLVLLNLFIKILSLHATVCNSGIKIYYTGVVGYGLLAQLTSS